MDILNGKYKIVGAKPQNGKATILTRKAGGGLRQIDLLAINEPTAELLINNGCRFLQKIESAARKGGTEKAS